MNLKKVSMTLIITVLFILGLYYILNTLRDDSSLSDDIIEETLETGETVEEAIVNKEPNDSGGHSTPILYEGEFELPIEGAAGYSSVSLPVYEWPDTQSDRLRELEPGAAFSIIEEEGKWWHIERGELTGWIEHQYAFINLPDIIPSIIYDNTNSYSSLFTSSGFEIPELTNKPLYQAVDYNERLDEETFIMPILYATAKKINVAQQHALSNGESLKIYETFRPFETQQLIANSLASLATENEAVHAGLNEEPWNQGWFIVTNDISNHQIGAAVDVNLVRIESIEEKVVGDFLALVVGEYTEYEMQTPMHELSVSSVIYNRRIPSKAREELLSEPLNNMVTEASARLQNYAAEAGLTPIASEWWHFNDLDAIESLGEESGKGEFFITETMNKKPIISTE